MGTRRENIAEPQARVRYAIDELPTGERRVMLERVPRHASVLDVGCWSGSAGRFLIEHRDVIVEGVEPDRTMAALAAHTYRNVFVASFEEFLDQSEGRYDRLLFLDVLEHLPDPSEPLRGSRRLVTPGGRALVSIPNVAHWTLRKELLLGRWRYEETGLLDRSHLRFFTRDSAVEMLEAAGWSIRWESASIGQIPLISVPEHWLSFFNRWPSLFGVQILFEIEPNEA
jgi:2-polyprenyl-3-methyl-5-hydroxy-6-metoxy-1,4-benzoquinol methylase